MKFGNEKAGIWIIADGLCGNTQQRDDMYNDKKVKKTERVNN